ncbi:MAG TPA: Lrp/AsnC family transcriptional regulator [Candidatus Thalassarchaeaceae archaeon]|nr:MAG TPA: Lrp/AsnC family transcriptional regulator [Candidatus Poseidoniales archaeon]HII49400.1 Lrp/AsnC family transcriptional regulator [Candidatus Thalassarchaeaceae archaeon]|tara:strand:- start:1708 stop:1944 length:237 start_codon:yes stop_codon:yes gene_type:complete
MAAIGFVLIKTETGSEATVREELEAIDLVEGRWGIFGSFDVLVKIVADDEVELTRCIMEQIRIIKGVMDTRTLIGSRI